MRLMMIMTLIIVTKKYDKISSGADDVSVVSSAHSHIYLNEIYLNSEPLKTRYVFRKYSDPFGFC